MTTSIARDDLVKFLEATGHPPRIVPVTDRPRGARTRVPDPDAWSQFSAEPIEFAPVLAI